VATYLAAVVALGNFVKAGYVGLPVYVDPTQEPTEADVANGWVELSWRHGKKGPVGTRYGPATTYYDTPGSFTLSILVPRERGTGPAWSAADALESLLLEAAVGDMTIETVEPVMHAIEDGDTHVQLDLVCGYYLEAFK
jgi:hypothetical protein